MVKKRILMIISCCVAIGLFTCLTLTTDRVTDLKTSEDSDITEPEDGFTFIEGIGLTYLTSGLIFQPGDTKDTIVNGFESLMSINLNNLDGENATETLSDALTSDDTDTNTESFYSLKETDTIDKTTNEKIDNDKTLTITMPKDINKEDIEGMSSCWVLNYRLYKEGLSGLDTSYWYSSWFDDADVYDRAFTSIKWLAKEYLNTTIINNKKNETFEFIAYGDEMNWYVFIDKANVDVFDTGSKLNVITMKIIPYTTDKTNELLKEKGLITETN